MSLAAPDHHVGRGTLAPGLRQQPMDCSRRPPRFRVVPSHPQSFNRAMGSFSSFQHMVAASCFACSVRHHVTKPRYQKVRTTKPRRIAMAANSSLHSEVDVLHSEVAKLLQEIRMLEDARASANEDKRRAIFVASDLNRSGGLDAEELRGCMRTHFSVDPDEESVAYVLEVLDSNKSGELELPEFSGEAVLHAYEQRARGEILAGQQPERAEMARAAKDNASGSKVWRDVLTEGNQDDGVLVRIGCALAYVLPICDGINFVLPLLLILPQLLPIAAPFVTLESLADSIPFGLLIWFLIMDNLSKQPWVPSLLRFNLSQAVSLDVRISLFTLFIRFFPDIVGSFVPLSQDSINHGMIQEEQTLTSLVVGLFAGLMGVCAFLLLATLVLYSVGCSLAGLVPERTRLLDILGLQHTSSEAK